MKHIKNAVTIITGASSGIGAATATRLAAEGAKVVLAGRNEERLQRLVSQIAADGGTASYKVADVTSLDDTRALANHATRTFGPVEILVNNAGLMLFSEWKETAVDDWNRMLDTNVKGYLHAIAAVVPSMIARKSGRILNMSSVAGIHVGEAAGVYGATKFFIRGMTESLRKEVGVPNNIQVSMVSPGVIDTGWADKMADGAGKDLAVKLNKDGIGPDAVADAIAYVLNQPPGVTVNDVVIHPTVQDW